MKRLKDVNESKEICKDHNYGGVCSLYLPLWEIRIATIPTTDPAQTTPINISICPSTCESAMRPENHPGPSSFPVNAVAGAVGRGPPWRTRVLRNGRPTARDRALIAPAAAAVAKSHGM
ncbi:hypothetical protein EVAR_59751_1 [Eumeta japonica]|uniref:Uncharacterized protein n=1 Tax=Eumeta variegata TaxID=151549 RepID=A0A4C1ZSJ8_EUMVA|nr:hypothetical protein EVAR_59751_1 [Eumeta japonica]